MLKNTTIKNVAYLFISMTCFSLLDWTSTGIVYIKRGILLLIYIHYNYLQTVFTSVPIHDHSWIRQSKRKTKPVLILPLVLSRYESWSLTLREQTLRVSRTECLGGCLELRGWK
jgi:hypothetical protein